jgi:hypothetical protein
MDKTSVPVAAARGKGIDNLTILSHEFDLSLLTDDPNGNALARTIRDSHSGTGVSYLDLTAAGQKLVSHSASTLDLESDSCRPRVRQLGQDIARLLASRREIDRARAGHHEVAERIELLKVRELAEIATNRTFALGPQPAASEAPRQSDAR